MRTRAIASRRQAVTTFFLGTALGALALSAIPVAAEPSAGAVEATVTTVPATSLEIVGGAIVDSGGKVRFVATTGSGGIDLYDETGQRIGGLAAGEAAGLDVIHGFPLDGTRTTLIATTDAALGQVRFFKLLADDTLTEVTHGTQAVGFAAENICFYRHALDGQAYAFVVGDGGEIEQRLVYEAAPGRVAARAVRRLQVPSQVEQCAADSASGRVYIAEEGVGLWRLSADAEADVDAMLIDSPRFGSLMGEVKGVALHDGGPGSRWLIASDSEAGRLNIYDRDADDRYLGSVAISSRGEMTAEPGRLTVSDAGAGTAAPEGTLALVDEDGPNLRVVTLTGIGAAIGRNPETPRLRESEQAPPLPTVRATIQTEPVASFGDAADDPAIWAHPNEPGSSLVIATDKKAGLYVHDMQGRVLQFLPVGKVNNVDVRDGFMLGGKPVTLVTASNRTTRGISILLLDPQTRTLTDVADGLQPTGLDDPYGQCMYRSARDGRVYVFINGDETRMRQWELVDAGNERVGARLVRDLSFDSQTEGCVADDETGLLYVGEEDVALWRMSAEPDGGADKTAVDRIATNTMLADDLEGVAIYDLGGGRGYIIASSQGNDSYAVWQREGGQAYLGSFAIVADPVAGIDGASETDGLDVTSRNLGPGFEHGALIVQDGRRVMPQGRQNYKYVPWQAIARALNLEMRDGSAAGDGEAADRGNRRR